MRMAAVSEEKLQRVLGTPGERKSLEARLGNLEDSVINFARNAPLPPTKGDCEKRMEDPPRRRDAGEMNRFPTFATFRLLAFPGPLFRRASPLRRPVFCSYQVCFFVFRTSKMAWGVLRMGS